MKPDQFTMWLRGALDSVGEGEAIPAKLAGLIHEKLTEVVGQQVAERMRETQPYSLYPPPPPPNSGGTGVAPLGSWGTVSGTTTGAIASRALDIEQYKAQTQYELELRQLAGK